MDLNPRTPRIPPPPGARRVRMVLAYDGADFLGWQRQPASPSVQATLEAAFARLLGAPVAVHACGRTDAGVHAEGQTAHADLPPAARLPLPALHKGLNALLPDSVRVLSLRPASPLFHARYDALAKQYRYRVWNAPVEHPLHRRTAHHVRAPLDLPAMRAAAGLLLGTHDFAAFAANPHRDQSSTVRTLHAIDLVKKGPLLEIRVLGDGFLYKMVRSIAGHLLRVGRHAVPPAETTAILDSRLRTARVETAPARGLSLYRVYYTRLPSRL